MLSLAVAVVAIALPDCINPTLIGAELFLVEGSDPVRQTGAFALAVFAVTLVVGLALALGLGDLILSILPKPGATLKYALITVAGLVLLLAAALVWVRRATLASSDAEPHRGGRSAGSAMLLGSGLGALEVLTAFPYFAAIAIVVGSSVSNSGKASLLVLYCVVYTAPLLGIAAVCAARKDRAQATLRPAIGWLSSRWPTFVAPLAAIIGIGLTTYGILRLSSS